MTIRIWKTLACVTLAACAAAAKDNEDMNADAIVNGVHGYMPENYVEPKEPPVREKLEWFKNQILELVRDYGPPGRHLARRRTGPAQDWPRHRHRGDHRRGTRNQARSHFC